MNCLKPVINLSNNFCSKGSPRVFICHGTLLLLLVLSTSSLLSQRNGFVHGKILDSAEKKPLVFATVCVYQSSDSSLVSYRLTDPDGNFRIPQIPLNGSYRLVITYNGYKVYRSDFSLTKDTTLMDFKNILLSPNPKELIEVFVKSEIPPVLVKKDTIEFNAASFKTLPAALVEDLLKKLPGVSIDEYGNIRVNGIRVNRILVDGKDFFGNDPKMATRNLPANIIEKVQVSKDREELDYNPNTPESMIGQVINLKLKKSVKKGLIGRAYAGIGSQKRYEIGSILNYFKDTLQISILGYGNNLSKGAFGYSDLQSLGGFKRSGNTVLISESGGIRNNSLSFGGSGSGIQSAGGFGVNLNHELTKKLNANFQYFYGQTKNDINEYSLTNQFFGDTILKTIVNRSGILKGKSHRIGLSIKWKKNPATRVEFKPSIYFTSQNNSNIYSFLNSSNTSGNLNASNSNAGMRATDITYNHSFLFIRNFKKQGENVNITSVLAISANQKKQLSNTTESVYFPPPAANNQIDQLQSINQKTFIFSANSFYTKPVSKVASLRLGYNVVYGKGSDTVFTWDRNPVTGKLDLYNTNLSSNLLRYSLRNNLSFGINLKQKKVALSASLGYLRLDLYNRFSQAVLNFNNHYSFLTPSFNLSWQDINASYSNSVTPALLSDIRPIADSSNPLFIFMGNPKLKPGQVHNFNLSYFKYINEKFLTLNLYLTYNLRNNATLYSRFINSSGEQLAVPVNVSSPYDITVFCSIEKQLHPDKNLQISIRGDFSFTHLNTYTIFNNDRSRIFTNEYNPIGQIRFNWKDIIEFTLSGNRTYSHISFEKNRFSNQKLTTTRAYNEIIVRCSKRFIIEGNLTYRYNSNGDPSVNKSYTLLNGGLTYLFLKDNRGQLKFYAFDILNENLAISRYSTENLITNSRSEILGQYFSLSFSYDIRGLNYKNAGGSNRLLLF